MGIQRLPSAVVSSLRTDVTVTTAAQCVTELVLNSIDAGAKCIAVRVDLKNLRFHVVDNGCGLSVSDLGLIGSRYMTSKCHSLQDLHTNLGHFGFRGEAVASIVEVCGTLTIVSRHQDSEDTFCKAFTQGKALKVGKSRQQRASCGTTVTVADFLYNRPVRKACIKPALDLEEVKTHIESIALVNPNVSFSLRNDVNNEVILQTQRTESIQEVFKILYGSNISKNLIAVKEVMSPFVVEGYISSEAHPLKNLQFVYVNKRLLLKTKLHKLINSLMSRSAILKSNNVPHIPISKEINHGVFLAFSPPKRDKHAIYAFNIKCPLSEYDITLDPKKTLVEFSNWDRLLSCFEILLRKFIERVAENKDDFETCLDSEPPRRVRTVIDEINELAREDALGGNILKSTDESISTKDLSQAVHSLPARRHATNLSQDPSSVEFFSSTSSSELLCRTQGENHEVSIANLSSMPSSRFTDKPYPTIRPRHTSKHVDENRTSRNESEEKSTETLVGKPKYSVEPLKRVIMKPQSSSSVQEGVQVKGFIAECIHFEEKFRRIPDEPQEKKAEREGEQAQPSPVNALANIKEIRRKKLLNNLNKFSFATAFEKPVLHKMVLPRNPTTNRPKTAVNHSNEVQNTISVLDVHSQKLCDRNMTETEVKNNACGPSISDCNEDSLSEVSRVATFQSTSVHQSSVCMPVVGISKQTDSISNFCGRKASDSAIELTVDKDSHLITFDISGTVAHSGGFNAQEVLNTENEVKSCYRTILSVEDMVVSGFDSFHPSGDYLPSAQKSGDIHLEDIKRPSKAPNANEKYLHLFHFRSNLFLDKNEEFCTDSNIEHKFLTDSVPISVSCQKNQKKVLSECVEQLKATTDVHQNQNSCDNLPLEKKLVDYDSSPSSSQENLADDGASTPNLLKRKQYEKYEETSKRICFSSNCSPTGTLIRDSENSLNPTSSKGITDPPLNESPEARKKCTEVTSPVHAELSSGIVTAEIDVPEVEFETQKNASGADEESSQSLPQENCEDSEWDWIEKFDDNGKPFYIHGKSGITTYNKPINKTNDSIFKFKERFVFLPKGMSPILRNESTNEPNDSPSSAPFEIDDYRSTVKWKNHETDEKTAFWPHVDQLLAEADKFSANIGLEQQVSSATLQDLPQSNIKVYHNMFPYSFTKEIFSNLRVLGQLDNKFIVTIATLDSNRDVVVLFDQHAVHERIRVENLTEEYKQHDSAATWRSSPVDPVLPLQLSAIEVRILQSYKNKIERLGLWFTVADPSTINIQRVPTCLLLRENRDVTGRGVSVLRQHLENFIREQVDSLLSTRGVGLDHPTIIQNVISSEACRGAIKFGHPLTVADCQAFLHNLSSCNLPFQCAHGRPALVPIVDLSVLKQKQQHPKLNFQKLKQ